MLREAVSDLISLLSGLEGVEEEVERAVEVIVGALKGGGKVLLCGNGGSATDAQHMAAELVGRLKGERAPLPALALTSDVAVLTALSNDYGWEDVFARQVRAIGRRGDVLIALSTSGMSENVNRAVDEAMKTGIKVVYLVGMNRGVKGDVVISVPSPNPQRVQEVHRLLLHVMAEEVERRLSSRPQRG